LPWLPGCPAACKRGFQNDFTSILQRQAQEKCKLRQGTF
jgi:hypothetical protein